MARQKLIRRFHGIITELHNCDALHVESVPLHLAAKGVTVWKGVVDVFDLIGHPRSPRCYAWALDQKTTGGAGKVVTVLELPPVVSPETAVKTFLANSSRATTI